MNTLDLNLENITTVKSAENYTRKTMKINQKACEEAIPRKNTLTKKRPAYWWNESISTLRKTCLKLRRIAQRAKKTV